MRSLLQEAALRGFSLVGTFFVLTLYDFAGVSCSVDDLSDDDDDEAFNLRSRQSQVFRIIPIKVQYNTIEVQLNRD